jgi:hypothetical protein
LRLLQLFLANNSKLAGCFVDTYSGNNSTLSCFVGNRQIGKWPNKHLEVLRYRSSGTIETVVTENNTVYMTIGANINTLMTVDDSSKRLVSVVFISEDRLALAFSVENGYVQVYLCTNLSTISNCTADGRIFVAQSGLTMGFVITKSNNYKYLFVGSVRFFYKIFTFLNKSRMPSSRPIQLLISGIINLAISIVIYLIDIN